MTADATAASVKLTKAERQVLGEVRAAGFKVGEFLPAFLIWQGEDAASEAKRRTLLSLRRRGLLDLPTNPKWIAAVLTQRALDALAAYDAPASASS